MASTRRKTYRINTDSVDDLTDLLVSRPEEFNSTRDRISGRAAARQGMGGSPPTRW